MIEHVGMRQAKTIIGELDLKWYKATTIFERNDLRMLANWIPHGALST